MNKKLIAIAIGAALGAGPLAAQAASDVKVKFFGFTQITAEVGELVRGNTADGLRFGADRVRIGTKVKAGKAFGKLQIDFNRKDISKLTAGMPEIIKDAEVGYKHSNAAKVKAGIFKTPVGMDFNTSGKKLDITKRGMEKALVLERAAGLMASGRKIGGGFGYDVGVFNPTTRSAAVNGGTAGSDIAWAMRLMYDMAKMLHLEASYGVSENAGGAGTEDYKVWDVAARYRSGPFTAKFEYIDGQNVQGNKNWDQNTWYMHLAWRASKMFEFLVRHYSGEVDRGTSSAELTNTYLGMNIFLGPKDHNARIQLNYVFVGGDEAQWQSMAVKAGSSAGGYTADGGLIQFQIAH